MSAASAAKLEETYERARELARNGVSGMVLDQIVGMAFEAGRLCGTEDMREAVIASLEEKK